MVLLWCALGLLAGVVAYDLLQRKHAILRNFPVIGHFRYLFEAVGPELRQYIVTNNNEERPFSRDQRRWVYASSKSENNYFGFGSDQDMELQPNHLIIKHCAFPLQAPHPGDAAYDPQFNIPCAKILGAARGRAKAFRPASVINISGMSFGSLSGPAVESLNRGAGIADCLHNTPRHTAHLAIRTRCSTLSNRSRQPRGCRWALSHRSVTRRSGSSSRD